MIRPRFIFRGRALLAAWTAAVLAVLYLPVLLLVIHSFNASRLNIRWGGFSLAAYRGLLGEHALIAATENSLIIAAVVTAFSVPLGTAAAWGLHRYRSGFMRSVDALAQLPIVMPDVIMGISLLIFFAVLSRGGNAVLTRLGAGDDWLGLGFLTVIISHITFCFPFVMVTVRARLAGLDPALEEAAMDLGATPFQAFIRVIVPYLAPALVSGGLLAFTLSMDELIITFFTYGAGAVTLPIKAFGMARAGMNPALNAISALLIGATAVLMCAADWFRRKAQIR